MHIQFDRPNRLFWWVNQGMTFAIERASGYLWALKHRNTNVLFRYWSDLTKLQPEDIVLHSANGVLRADSKVLEAAKDEPRPGNLDAYAEDKECYFFRVEYYLLEPPITLQNIPLEWRNETTCPFTKDDEVKQEYFFPLTNEFTNRLQDRFGAVLLAFLKPWDEHKRTPRDGLISPKTSISKQ